MTDEGAPPADTDPAEPATPATGAGRLWGGRFADGPDEAAWSLGRSVDTDRRLWPQDLAGSRAHADELLRIGILDPGDHAVILDGLAAIRAEFERGRFAFRADDEDLHGAVERRLVELCGETGGRLRAGRSRNDQIANDLRQYLAEAIDGIVAAIVDLQESLAEQAERCVDWLAPGYTHLQRAQPVTLGHHLLAHAWALDRDRSRLRDARARMLEQSPLGAGAMAGLTLDLDPASYASALGYAGPAANSMDAVADRDFAVEFLAAGAMVAVHLSRLGEEIVLWSSTEFGWARVGDAFSTGSSIMPQKRNPDVAELVRGQAGRVIGDLVALLVTLKGLPLTYNRDLQEDKPPVFDTVDTLRLALPAMSGTVRSLVFDRRRLADTAAGGYALATDVAEELVRQGVAFRVAHERVGESVAALEAEGLDFTDVDADRLRELLPELADADCAVLTDAAAAVARRSAVLGPAPDRVREQAASLRRRLRAPTD
jgi:argininosuccinate lyase